MFKDRNFLDDVKVMYTDLINQVVDREEDKLQIFDASGPYLATKKIGKNNPRENEIRSDNQLRQEWNQTVDQVLIAGGSQEEVTEFKWEEVVQKVSESVKIRGTQHPERISGSPDAVRKGRGRCQRNGRNRWQV